MLDDYKDRIATRLRQARDRVSLQQKQVAEAVGVSEDSIRSWERGRSMPTADRLGQLAELYACSVDWIVGRPASDSVYLINHRALGLIDRVDSLDKLLPLLCYASVEPDQDVEATTDPNRWFHYHAEALRRADNLREGEQQ